MASRLIKEERAARQERLKRAEDSRKHMTKTLHTLGSHLDAELKERITTIHQNAHALDQQSKTLQNRTVALQKQTKQWSAVAEGARGRLKEIGDIQNWAEMIEHDLLVIEETLNIVYGDDLDSNSSATASGVSSRDRSVEPPSPRVI